jgi:hypothetical protein
MCFSCRMMWSCVHLLLIIIVCVGWYVWTSPTQKAAGIYYFSSLNPRTEICLTSLPWPPKHISRHSSTTNWNMDKHHVPPDSAQHTWQDYHFQGHCFIHRLCEKSLKFFAKLFPSCFVSQSMNLSSVLSDYPFTPLFTNIHNRILQEQHGNTSTLRPICRECILFMCDRFMYTTYFYI